MESKISGKIPNELGSLTELQQLYLRDNNLSGSIPDVFQDMKSLYMITVGNNKLTGNIPSSLTKLPTLKYLNVYNNQLSGPLPNFSGSQLNEINISNNYFTGSINVPQDANLTVSGNCFSSDVVKSIPVEHLDSPNISQRPDSECKSFSAASVASATTSKPSPSPITYTHNSVATNVAIGVSCGLLFMAFLGLLAFVLWRQNRKERIEREKMEAQAAAENARLESERDLVVKELDALEEAVVAGSAEGTLKEDKEEFLVSNEVLSTLPKIRVEQHESGEYLYASVN
ncbi:hypothetical protein HDU97_005406 [Phlyctochytrium planicorne]|nr:hypothetical protein HDU97_005406 [Phlyctochytrium planicorne]